MRTRSAALLALAIVLALKLVVLASLGSHPLLEPAGELDGAYYRFFAEQVASGDVWLERPESFFGHPPPPFFVSPLYIYFLAFVLKLGGSVETARLVQVVLGTAGVGLLALTARRWYGTTAAWLTGTLAALCGLFTFYEILILQAALDPFLTAVVLYALTRAVEGRSTRWWAATGAALGLHILNRPNLLVVLGGLAALVVVRHFMAARRKIVAAREQDASPWRMTGKGLVLFATGLLVIAPVTARNWMVSGELVLVSSHGGFNFLVGNGPQSDGTFTHVLDLEPSITGQWLGAVDTVRRETGREPTAGEVSSYFYGEAWRWIRSHPVDEIALIARKTWYGLSADFLTLNHSFPFFVKDVGGPLAWLVVGPGLIVPLGLVGLVLARPREASGYWLWAAYLPLAFAALIVFYVAARYRLPYQIALTVSAGGGLAWAAEQVRQRPRRLHIPALAVFSALLFIVNWPTGLDDGRAEEQVRMGLRAIEEGRTAEGEAWIERALEHHALPGAVHVRAGQAHESGNALADALRHYDEALALDPDEPSVQFVRGRALYHLGRIDDARVALERARSGPQADAALRLLVLTAVRGGDDAAAQRFLPRLAPGAWTPDEARQFGQALMDLGRADLGVTAWQRAAEAGGTADDYERLGLALAVAGRPDEAVSALRQGVRLNDQSASLRLNLAVMLVELGEIEEAKKEAAEALRLDPDYDRAKALLAAISGRN